MTVIVLAISHATRDWRGRFLALFALLLFVLVASQTPEHLLSVLTLSLSEAYLQVGVFVALTLYIFGWLEDRFGIDIAALARTHSSQEIVIAALLGALPGCGGAIMVVTYYIHGRLSFAALVTALIATMGDAAFLILAVQPSAGLLIMGISFCAAIITGLIVLNSRLNITHVPRDKTAKPNSKDDRLRDHFPPIIQKIWIGILIPASFFAIGDLVQYDWSSLFVMMPVLHDAVGVIGCIYALMLWACFGGSPVTSYKFSRTGRIALNLVSNSLKNDSYNSNKYNSNQNYGTDDHHCADSKNGVDLNKRVIGDTNFVLFWVVAGFVIFNVMTNYMEFDLYALAQQSAILLPLFALVIGFLPGCGPQIIVASMFLQGVIPFSALLGNAMNNDGDALFPAIALAPKTAIIATILTAVPSLICAYLYAYLFEGLSF